MTKPIAELQYENLPYDGYEGNPFVQLSRFTCRSRLLSERTAVRTETESETDTLSLEEGDKGFAFLCQLTGKQPQHFNVIPCTNGVVIEAVSY